MHKSANTATDDEADDYHITTSNGDSDGGTYIKLSSIELNHLSFELDSI